jgi:hypothetical protein
MAVSFFFGVGNVEIIDADLTLHRIHGREGGKT